MSAPDTLFGTGTLETLQQAATVAHSPSNHGPVAGIERRLDGI